MKNSKPTTRRKPKTKIVRPKSKKTDWLYEYTDVKRNETVIISETFIDKLAVEFVDWAVSNPKAFVLKQFRLDRGITETTWYRWLEAFPALDQAHKFVMEVVGARREALALEKKIDSGMAMFTMPVYDKDWKALYEWRSSLKNKEDRGAGSITVLMDSFDSKPINKSESNSEDSIPLEARKTPEEVAGRIRRISELQGGGHKDVK